MPPHYVQLGFLPSPCSPLPLGHRDVRKRFGSIRCLLACGLHVHNLMIPAAGRAVNEVDQKPCKIM